MNINNYCLNCEKIGHILNKCKHPVTSYGVVSFNVEESLKIPLFLTYQEMQFINIMEYNYKNLSNISHYHTYMERIKFLMIMRRHSFTYIEFLRGKYNLYNKENIKNLFKLMSWQENLSILTNTFDMLWNNLWMITAHNYTYKKEYINAMIKFNKLKEYNFYNLLDSNNLSVYSEPEWGFPKGRKNINENIKTCAMREYIEETTLQNTVIMDNINMVEELYVGTNNVNYKNSYYIGYNPTLEEPSNIVESFEIGDIKWVTLNECLGLLRPYEKVKKVLIHNVYFFILNMLRQSSK